MLPNLLLCIILLIRVSHQEIARLPEDVIPTSYNLNLSIPVTIFDDNFYSGVVEIALDIKEEVNTILLHVSQLELEDVELVDKTGDAISITYETDDSAEILAIDSETPLVPDSGYVLTIAYRSRMEEKSMTGFFKSVYYDSAGTKKIMGATMFEPMYARTAFPCFDEPALKAVFTITITHPAYYYAVANTEIVSTLSEDNFTTTRFKPTPPISPYLVAFSISDFVCVTGSGQVPIELCTTPEANKTSPLALELTPKVLTVMEELTGYKYRDMGFGKITLEAVPDMKYSMENWGLPFYRQEDLIWDENESSNRNTQQVLGALVRVLSGQWFGDLVTIDWWSDVFIKNSFATYFQYYAADSIQESWELKKQLVVEQLQPALLADSLDNSLPLLYNAEDAEDLISHLEITYNKGGSLLAMVHHILGEEKFNEGLASFVSQGLVTTTETLWNSFGADDTRAPLSQIMENWTKKAGYPLLTVTTDGAKFTISQEQFLLSGSGDTKWYVPISYTLSNDVDNFGETKPTAWLTPEDDLELLEDADWIILNNQQTGFYRVSYDDTILAKIFDTLRDDVNTIDEMSRSQLVDDQLNLARAGQKPYTEVLQFLTFLQNDDSYFSWSSAFNGFAYLLQRITDQDLRDNFTTYIRNLMATLVESTSIDDDQPGDQIYTFKQALALKWLCDLGDQDCIATAKRQFLQLQQDEIEIDPNLRGVIYCTALRNSDNATRDYNFLWKKFQETQLAHEYVTILGALGCVNDDELRRSYAHESVTYEVAVRRQDAEYVYSSLYSYGPDGVTDVLDLVAENYTLFQIHFPDNMRTLNTTLLTISELITTEEQLDSLTEFSRSDGLVDEAVKTVVLQGIDIAKKNLETNKVLEDNLVAYFGSVNKI